ncbi:hypothetical protein CDAR_188541 [Caerostris darwini]|uniref:Uncharacterized protein n=1 Tax=Caerostris darwini TaxID=1538125 RepID=A0AAV4V750_9ARAC|nr:hypothetical protein CDAR_188411 [Caerostris darwini]GIY65780.1 hypothetical protein CDAR_188541 [Caerostris darwini]
MKPRAAENRDFSFNSFLKTSWLQTNECEEDASDFQYLRSTGEFCIRPVAVVCLRPGGEAGCVCIKSLWVRESENGKALPFLRKHIKEMVF